MNLTPSVMSKSEKTFQVYLKTMVFNYYFDEDRQGHEDVIKLFEAIRAGEFEAYTSELVMKELERAKEPKRSNMLALVKSYKLRFLISTFIILFYTTFITLTEIRRENAL